MNTELQFHNIPLSLVEHHGKPWLTAEQVGVCLGYAQANARKGIMKLFERHADEFTEVDKGVVKMTTPGGIQNVTIFSQSGCVLLSMFANTPRAKEFRAWAKQVLADRPIKGVAEADTPLTVEARLDRLENAVVKMGSHMATLVEVSAQQAQKLDMTARYIGLLEINQKGTVKITRVVEAQAIALKAQGWANVNIARQLRISPASVTLLLKGDYKFSAVEAAKLPLTVEEILDKMIDDERRALLGRVGGA
jgi:prophage antirepressor-like protein